MTISTYRKVTVLVLALAVAAMVLVLPQTTRALFDDVNLTADNIFTIDASSFTITGTTDVMETIAISPTTIAFQMEAGSTISMKSTARPLLGHDAPAGWVTQAQCLSGERSEERRVGKEGRSRWA